MPTGQVLRWQTRIMTQPAATSGAVEKPNSSAPSSAPIDDVAAGAQAAVDLQAHAAAQLVADQHLLRLGQAELPGQAGVLDRRQRRGAGAAVVPAITMWSAPALATPAAIVPTPASATSLTEISAAGLTQRRSWISCARSSIE